jgi:DNA-binding transcriptional MerR regulator
MADLKIGALADRTGTNAPTIRYYEEIGLLPSADRQAGGQRIYGDEDVRLLTFIRRCREFDFPIEAVRTMVAVLHDPKSSCKEARDLAHRHLVEVRQKISDLRALERSIAAFVTECDASCAGGPGPNCVILDDLSKRSCGAAVRSRASTKARASRQPHRSRATRFAR